MTTKNEAIFLLCVLSCLIGCTDHPGQNEQAVSLFKMMPSNETGIAFKNELNYDEKFNVYTYRNYYNGGGVAIGDINNDGLSDIYFTANQGSNKLYLNKGNFKFEDITESAGVGGRRSWSTGVNMVDINGDGLLDIHVCNSGDIDGDDKQNELFINNGDNTFSEQAEVFGLADQGLTTHASFFDYDHDGDLDVYVLNNSFRAIGSFNLKDNERSIRDIKNGDKLYRNNNGHFEDVSESAGIYGSTIGFGLGVMVSDLDGDGWEDLYICNDFFERDYIYMNNRDGTFREDLPAQMPSISMASMGVDAVDMNNDGFPEIFVTEMLPKDEARLKTSMTFENWNKYQYNKKNGYHNQFTRNMFQVNNGPIADKGISFSEMSRFSRVEATDWSWSVLMADFNLDGYKDVYITNGVYQDILNQDYLNYISSEVVARSMITEHGVNYKKLIDIIPSHPISNVAFSGGPDMQFNDSTQSWGLEYPGFSNGMAYGDLDNDGDLDMVVNNVNMEAFVYRNQVEKLSTDHHFLKLKLVGAGPNTHAIGAKTTIIKNGKVQILDLMPTRGFQSSMDYALHFGMKDSMAIDTVLVEWPNGKTTLLKNVLPDQALVIDEKDAESFPKATFQNAIHKLGFSFKEVPALLPNTLNHEENKFNDFDKEAMIFQMNSTEGPKLAVGDVNGDGLQDIFLCGAKGYSGKMFLQRPDGSLMLMPTPWFEDDKRSEDVDALFFDADSDGDQDLYVVSGSNEYNSSSSALSDRLYLNNGGGGFAKSKQLLPTTSFESTSCVKASDFDKDGDLDLFVGVRLEDRQYGIPQNGYILENNGKGEFTDISSRIAPGLKGVGMIKDAIWADFNNDQREDLIVVGEWMSVQLFQNNPEGFENISAKTGIDAYKGWWNTIEAADIDQDGDIDFILGNHGLNSRFRASQEKPVSCYINDFDQNGTIEQIVCTYNGDKAYPISLRHEITAELPYLKKRFLKYEDYKLKEITDIFDENQLKNSVVHKATFLESAVLMNTGNATFKMQALPWEAQLTPIYAIHVADFDGDGNKDLLLAGNLSEVKPEIGKYDASYGVCLLGDGRGGFNFVPNRELDLYLNGQVRDMEPINLGKKNILLVAKNNDMVEALEVISNRSTTKATQ